MTQDFAKSNANVSPLNVRARNIGGQLFLWVFLFAFLIAFGIVTLASVEGPLRGQGEFIWSWFSPLYWLIYLCFIKIFSLSSDNQILSKKRSVFFTLTFVVFPFVPLIIGIALEDFVKEYLLRDRGELGKAIALPVTIVIIFLPLLVLIFKKIRNNLSNIVLTKQFYYVLLLFFLTAPLGILWPGNLKTTRQISEEDALMSRLNDILPAADEQTRQNLETILAALKKYYADNSSYPDSIESLYPIYLSNKTIFIAPITELSYLYQRLDNAKNFQLCGGIFHHNWVTPNFKKEYIYTLCVNKNNEYNMQSI